MAEILELSSVYELDSTSAPRGLRRLPLALGTATFVVGSAIGSLSSMAVNNYQVSTSTVELADNLAASTSADLPLTTDVQEDTARIRMQPPDADALSGTLRMLLAAIEDKAVLPSATLARLGIAVPNDANALKRFRSKYPVAITHDEVGAPIGTLGTVVPIHIAEASDEEELVFLDLDD